MKCIHLIVSGRVQGVFFRANVKRKAIELNLNGYAKNLKDDNVEIVAEGDENKINELVYFIRENPGTSKVTDIKIKKSSAQNFKNFEIIH